MPREPEFQPEPILRTLTRHGVEFVVIGGFAATIHGSEFVTYDVDIVPEPTPENLERLSAALREMNARIRTRSESRGLPFDHDAASLGDVDMLNLVTDYGQIDITNAPAGTHGYEDVRRDAARMKIGNVDVLVASLADVVRSKEAAGRDKDLRVLPTLRRLLDESPD